VVEGETQNPTWSYKDWLAAVAVTRAAQDGADTVVVSSTGNHGAAVAAYAARAGLRCVVLTLASVPLAIKALMRGYGAIVAAVEESAARWAIMREGIEQRGWVPRPATDRRPFDTLLIFQPGPDLPFRTWCLYFMLQSFGFDVPRRPA